MADKEKKPEGQVLERTKPKTRRPTLYKVILHNDDYTTMEFVVEVLESIYEKSPAEAFGIMMQVHLAGSGMCGVYPFEIAETKVFETHEAARTAGYPLLATMEEE